jgi:TIR domain
MNAYIFVSYSREDEPFITQIVQLLRAAISGVPSVQGHQWEFVFQDTDHLTPGLGWEDQIDTAISTIERMFVFWCKHSARSSQVEREYMLGLEKKRVVIPVLLDDTILSAPLAEIHGIDLRELRIHGPRIAYMQRPPGVRSFLEVVIEEFSRTLDIDPNAMRTNVLMKYDPT